MLAPPTAPHANAKRMLRVNRQRVRCSPPLVRAPHVHDDDTAAQLATRDRKRDQNLTELVQLGSYTLFSAAKGCTRVGKERTGFVPCW